MPVPQKTFFLVERASCPFQNLIKRTFARGLLIISSKLTQLARGEGAIAPSPITLTSPRH
ncbi:hypothetical protein QUB70_12795 [Microcoleus sp. A003_D6]